jgi:DNA-binding response OmpR family regulator
MNTKPRILIIDDDQALAESVKISLEATERFEVRVEHQSVRAVNTAREFAPDLILLDYIMPGSDGGDVSRHFRADPALKHVPIIMVTALISNEETGAAGTVQRGVHTMMAKPLRIAKLVRIIDERLGAAAAH